MLKSNTDTINEIPFSSTYSPEIPNLLAKLRISLCISTYQAGKIIFISPNQQGRLTQLPRHFEKPMDFGFNEDYTKLAVESRDTVSVFAAFQELAYFYQKKTKTYDVMFYKKK